MIQVVLNHLLCDPNDAKGIQPTVHVPVSVLSSPVGNSYVPTCKTIIIIIASPGVNTNLMFLLSSEFSEITCIAWLISSIQFDQYCLVYSICSRLSSIIACVQGT